MMVLQNENVLLYDMNELLLLVEKEVNMNWGKSYISMH